MNLGFLLHSLTFRWAHSSQLEACLGLFIQTSPRIFNEGSVVYTRNKVTLIRHSIILGFNKIEHISMILLALSTCLDCVENEPFQKSCVSPPVEDTNFQRLLTYESSILFSQSFWKFHYPQCNTPWNLQTLRFNTPLEIPLSPTGGGGDTKLF